MQRNEKKAATVFDVAEKAGVSRGTVDRVIYGRGRFSEASRQRVMEAIAQLHYTPNANASSLASRKLNLFSVIIPEFKSGDYWDDINKGFLDAARTFSGSNIDLRVHTYNILDVDSFVHACEDVLEEKPDGVILNAIFPEETIAFALSLEQEDTPYAFIDSKIDDLNYTLFYGIDSYKYGKLGAALLTNHLEPKELLLVRVESTSSTEWIPTGPGATVSPITWKTTTPPATFIPSLSSRNSRKRTSACWKTFSANIPTST